MNNPLIRKLETSPSQKIVIILTGLAAIASVIIFLLMRPVEAALKAASPYGVMELEFAWTMEQIEQIFGTWTEELITQELTVTYIDYGFLLAYSTFLAGITLLIVRKLLSGQIQLVGLYMTIVPFIAALFDAIENLNLILMLSSPSNFPTFSPFLASFFATLKFGLLILVLVFWIISLVWFLYQRSSHKS
ncbi:MAG: hypothetical protein JSW11_04610 [Candidatus Heimdallarchaeota archaeon]|nr:MAG: hypothetical protein JSW11_04610 [Candidatus Heimdallarchaeota archaeon]